MEITENVIAVKERIAKAAALCGRDPSEIALVAASKMNSADKVKEAVLAGVDACGENRVQELVGKMDHFEELGIKDIEWHLIGHLQTNKVKYIIGRVAMIHSVDSEKLAKAIDDESAKKGVVTDILVELNIGDEESKFGLDFDNTLEFVEKIAGFKHIRVKGLMCVAPYTDDPEENRQFFSKMKKLSVDIANKNIDNVSMCELSMGMTGDYMVAIEEGATCVRVGTGIFGKRDYSIK